MNKFIKPVLTLCISFSFSLFACSSEQSPVGRDSETNDSTEDIGILDAGTDIGTFKSRLTRYPYVNYNGNDSFTIFWETDRDETGYVELDGKILTSEKVKLSLKMGLDSRVKNIYQHTLKLKFLPQEKKYIYKILSLATPFEGSFYSVSSDNNFIFAVYGDNRPGAPFMETNPTHKDIASQISKYEPEFVINTGDIVYTGGFEDEWYQFFNDGATLFKKTSLFVSIGNHESGGEDIFRRQFSFTNGENFYYSFDWGQSHFIVLCVQCGISTDTEQYKWLKNDIETADSNKSIKHIFVTFHHPPYTFSSHSPNSDARNYIVPLLKTTRTRLVFNGHNHLYEHIYKDKIHYLVSGGGGAPLYPEEEIKYEEGEEPYMVKYQMVYNYSILYVEDTGINVKTFDNNNNLIEEFSIDEER